MVPAAVTPFTTRMLIGRLVGNESSLDEASAFEGEDHLVDGGRGDAEEALHVGFGGRAGIDAGV
jgi:hypothetical protein